jgi:hypothetical protein
VATPDRSRILGGLDGSVVVLPAPEDGHCVVGGTVGSRQGTTAVAITGETDHQLCPVHEKMWVSTPFRFIEGARITITWRGGDEPLETFTLPPLLSSMLSLHPVGYACS